MLKKALDYCGAAIIVLSFLVGIAIGMAWFNNHQDKEITVVQWDYGDEIEPQDSN